MAATASQTGTGKPSVSTRNHEATAISIRELASTFALLGRPAVRHRAGPRLGIVTSLFAVPSAGVAVAFAVTLTIAWLSVPDNVQQRRQTFLIEAALGGLIRNP